MNYEKLNKIIQETLSELDLEERRKNEITPATHKIIMKRGGGCRTCGLCHPNRCFSCDGGGYECHRADGFADNNKYRFVAKSVEDMKNERMKNKSAEMVPSMNEGCNERFQELAGIKPLYENEDIKSIKEYTKEELMNEGPELWTTLGGIMGVIGAANVVGQIQAMAEDPIIGEKYPKLKELFSMLAKLGGSLGSGIK